MRVLYKDWIAGRWKGLEAQIARIILSASEPFALLISPFLWKYNNSLLITDTNDFINLPQNKQNELVKKIIQTGIRDDEVILAGSIRDYTHNHEVFGFYLSYFSIPEMPSSYAAHKFERNSRYFLQRRADFMEYKHYNVTLHHNGVESFKDSNISCGLSKAAQIHFGWSILLSPDGFVLLNSEGNKIGHLEYYYAYRSSGNRNLSNQPCLQRWIIKRKEFSEQLPWPICTVIDNVSEKIE